MSITATIVLMSSMWGVLRAEDRFTEEIAVLTDVQWRQLDEAVDRALRWISTQQQPYGAFIPPQVGQPGITSLAILAFASRGHLPDHGQYGNQLNRAIAYLLACQRSDGLFSHVKRFPQQHNPDTSSHSAVYNDAITGLALSELYGMTDLDDHHRVTNAIAKALSQTFELQDRAKRQRAYEGGWRYLYEVPDYNSDLSVTSWQLMFLRSAKNAGFDVRSERIDRGMRFVFACFDRKIGTFGYWPVKRRPSRGMAAAGILALAHSGASTDLPTLNHRA